jgi:hypothetical protein
VTVLDLLTDPGVGAAAVFVITLAIWHTATRERNTRG